MSGRVLFTEEEYDIIRNFIVEHNMIFGSKNNWSAWNEVAESQLKYLEQNTKGMARCPICGRLYIGTDEDGVGWCIKCDWN